MSDSKKRQPNFGTDEVEVLLQGVEKNSKVRCNFCLDQLLIVIRSLTLLCDHSRSKARLIAMVNLIATLGTPLHAMPTSAQPSWS